MLRYVLVLDAQLESHSPPFCARFTFMASSQTPGVVEDELICTEIVEKGGGGKTIFRTGERSLHLAYTTRYSIL